MLDKPTGCHNCKKKLLERENYDYHMLHGFIYFYDFYDKTLFKVVYKLINVDRFFFYFQYGIFDNSDNFRVVQKVCSVKWLGNEIIYNFSQLCIVLSLTNFNNIIFIIDL